MKKVIFGFLLIATFTLVSVAGFAQKSVVVGVVDMETVLKEMPEAINADQMLKDLQKRYNDSLVAMQTDFQKRIENYQKQQAMMTADKKQQEEDALRAQEQAFVKFREEKLAEIAQRREAALEPIRTKVKSAVEAIAKEENMTIVINKVDDLVLFSDAKSDITYKVIDRIKRGGAK